jgi:hypothetical protein
MVGFINAHRDAYGVEPICAVLPVAPSTYYELRARQRCPDRRPLRARGTKRSAATSVGCGGRTVRSTASARCGSSCGGKAVQRPAVQWRA